MSLTYVIPDIHGRYDLLSEGLAGIDGYSGGDAGTIAQRTLRHDVASTAAFLLETQVTAWVRDDPAHASWTAAQVDAEVSKQMGISTDLRNTLRDYFNAGLISSTNDRIAKGTEIELNYNPTNYWTLAANVTETQQYNANVSADVQKWLDQRMPVWTTITDPRGADHVWGTADDRPVQWWTTNYGGSQTPASVSASTVPSSAMRQ